MLNELAKAAYDNAVAKGFYNSGEVNVGERIALMHSELTEALEEFRMGYHINDVRYEDGKPEGLPIELADCIIRILDFCSLTNIDIDKAIEIKMAYNTTRPYKHGKLI